jgi:hypothetical protein
MTAATPSAAVISSTPAGCIPANGWRGAIRARAIRSAAIAITMANATTPRLALTVLRT